MLIFYLKLKVKRSINQGRGELLALMLFLEHRLLYLHYHLANSLHLQRSFYDIPLPAIFVLIAYRLPAPRPLSRGFTVWTVLKNAVGRDLNHITMPATINEPLSVLQKCAEELQYR